VGISKTAFLPGIFETIGSHDVAYGWILRHLVLKRSGMSFRKVP